MPNPDALTQEAIRLYFEYFCFEGYDRISVDCVREHMKNSVAAFTSEEVRLHTCYLLSHVLDVC